MKKYCLWIIVLVVVITLPWPVYAITSEYRLTIERQPVNITGNMAEKITINGSIPGPTLRFREGDDAIIYVTNKMKKDTSVHWHGILLPDSMDGAPGFGGFDGIKPGETFTYRFKIRQDGTYWYHAHSGGQEQDGLYGSIIISPSGEDPVRADREYVILLSDYTDEDAADIMSNLKKSAEYYQYNRRTVGDFFADVRKKGFSKAWGDAKMWGRMRMLPTDLSDVSGYTFLVNGKTPDQNWTGLFKRGESVRLRFINASAMSLFDVRIPGLKLTVVAADGQNVEPLKVDEFRFGIAETYDVIVTPEEEKAYTIVAEPIDRTGFALATLAPREGMRGEIPAQRPRALLTIADMGMSHQGDQKEGMDHSSMGHSMPMSGADDYDTGVPGSGWAKTGAPSGTRVLAYKDLRYLGIQKDARPPEREIEIRLGGNMDRYIWTINGKKYSESVPIYLKYGERVRLKFVNETMMAHPMHLHGMFVQLENGQPSEKQPNKHVVIVAPGDTYSALLTANEAGEWAFHCHMIYHMKSGMMTKVVVAKSDPSQASSITPMQHDTSHGAPPIDHSGHGLSFSPSKERAGEDGGHQDTHEDEALISGPSNLKEAGSTFTPDVHAKEHGGQIFSIFMFEMGGGLSDGDGTVDWHFNGWIGTDDNKLWLKSKGERTDGETEDAELWALYSRNVATFWDAHIGVRYDVEPKSVTYLVLGIEGLAPYFFETEAHLFVAGNGDISARLRLENDLLLTQRLILQPHLEVNLYAQDVPKLDVGAGLSNTEIGFQTRFEITRKFAPYIDLTYDCTFGETSSIARSHGEDVDAVRITVGLRLMF